MFTIKIAQVIQDYLSVAFLYVLSIQVLCKILRKCFVKISAERYQKLLLFHFFSIIRERKCLSNGNESSIYEVANA